MKVKFLLISFFISCIITAQPLHPFPQHSTYFDGVIVPDHISQKELDDSVTSFYDQWKEKYLKQSACSNSYYIWAENSAKNYASVSEGQGYGMMIMVLMAGYDTAARSIFDGLFRYYKEHPSKRNQYLMSWAQINNCKEFEESAATDGDIDIAYSLLLANAQWTSNSGINYFQEAKNIVNAIEMQDINKTSFTILESNSIEEDSRDYFDMRSSDFIPSEIRSFSVTDSNTWAKVLNNNYTLFNFLQNEYSDGTGLVPDFIQSINIKPKPARRLYLESIYDGMYYYNACRVPWRIATDYIVNGDVRAKKFIAPINKWIQETTQGNPDNISAGYSLQGDDIKTKNFEALSFITSFAVAAMIDNKNQQWLNSLWDYTIHFKLNDFDYYDNTIKMINLVILSHNYWAP
ncbi:glycosyl hydrolase family 8 [Ferruginibacter albus]|uniref:glycosyl hydrolase family 8 n=1 Tax=Ferruginibacter albus TaxID=2875540 RepID=UPI001CC7F974|nr:glycosyl hydrolase family 8 [Ferruginibacter albus]UAY51125.1 hypothetical protein K9M53_11040 [Ferruginibacter albus]